MEIKKRIVLIRHGATDYNDRDLMQGHIDLPLSERGVKQAEALKDKLGNETFDIIYHSPLLRAIQTADIVNKIHKLEYKEIKCFKEINIGEWEGEKFSEVFTKHNDIYKLWIADARTRIPGGESYVDVQNRVREGIVEILNSEYKDILIFGHAAVNRGILGNLLNMSPDLSRRFRLNNCSYSTFKIYENRIKGSKDIIENSFVMLENWNVSTHLQNQTGNY